MSLGKKLFLGGTPACTTDTVDKFADSSGVALYSLDYDASDAGGNYNGTPSNVTFGVDGQINYGTSFNGTSSYITANKSMFGTGDGVANLWSISLWFKTDGSVTASRTLVGTKGNSIQPGFFLYMISGGQIRYYEGNTSTNSQQPTTTASYDDGNWHNVVMTRSGTTDVFTMYIDGAEVIAPTTMTNPHTSHNFNLHIGRYTASAIYFWDGTIDQVRVFNKALSSSEVSTLYAETACVYTSTTDNNDYPVTNAAYYKLDNNAEDAKGSYNGAESNITYDFGRFGQAAVFNDSAITTSLNIGRTNDFTISFWVKDISDSNYGSYGYKWVAGVYNNDYIPINYNKTTGKILLSVHDGTTALGDLETPALDDNWHHIVFTQDVNVETKLYLDGVLQTSETISHASMTQRRSVSGGTGFYFAQNPANSSNDLRYRGKLDQVRIYNSALDAAAVENLYNEKQAYITKNASDPFGDGSEDLFLELNNNVEDSSDQSNDCSSSCLFTTDSLFGSHSADIVTTTQDSRIVVPSDNDLYHSGGTFTISMWAKTDTAISSNYRTLWGMYERNPDLSGHGAFLVRLNSGKIKVENYNNAWFLKTSDFTPSVDRWYHYCFTVNGGTMEVFIDGSLHATHTGLNIDYTASTSPNPQLTLGGYNQAGSIRSYWDGKLDNIRFFDRALDGDEVFKLYAEVIN